MILIAFKGCNDDFASRHETGLYLRNRLLNAAFGKEAEKRVYIGRNERPCIDIENADISVSHSKRAAAAAVSLADRFDSELLPENTVIIDTNIKHIGIDIELIEKRNILLKKKIVKKYFSEKEKRFLLSLDNDSFFEEFFKMWTVKESYAKSKSGGIKTVKACDTFKISPLFSKKIKFGEEEYFISVTGKKSLLKKLDKTGKL